MTEAPAYDAALVDLLAESLDRVGFAAGRIGEVTAGSGFGLGAVPVLARRLAAGDPLAPLVAMFVHGAPVAADVADAALAPLGLAGAERLGIAGSDGGSAWAEVRMAPFGDLVLASDRPVGVSRDFVMGGSGSTRTLANLTVRRPVATALDLGTGSGVQAFLAARHAERVTATDVSPRALAFARFNARLNRVDNVELVEGPWFEPVAGRRFDLVVSNPPFVVSPDAELLFRDGADGGDDVSRRIVQEAPGHLTDGGLAAVLVSWARRDEEGWADAVRSWVAGRPCDTWLLHISSEDPGQYAVEWNAYLARDPVAQAVVVERWLDWYARNGVRAIGYGFVLLRRHDGSTWFRGDELPDVPDEPAGDQLAAGLDAHDALGRLRSVDDLLDRRPVASPRHRLQQELRPEDGRYVVERARLRLDEPLEFTAEVDAFAATLLTLLDGRRTLREAVAGAAEVLDEPPEDLAARAAGLVATMVAMGVVRLV